MAPLMNLPSDQDATGRDLGEEELAYLKEAVLSGTLTSTKGQMVPAFEKEFAERYGVPFCAALSSGTAAIHTALAALDLEPGDEVLTTPVTDMGAITPILYQGLIPVFADIDPRSYNLTAETLRRRISPKTKAVIVTHLFGNPCDMAPIMELAVKHGLKVIEDCAQSFLASYRGRLTGTIGDIGAFSLQQGKHMTTGEGGMVITKDPDLAGRMRLFVNKAWGYGDPRPDHYFLALNYRLSELQGAVARAQLKKLDANVKRRREAAGRMDKVLSGVPGLGLPAPPPDSTHVYWKYCLDVTPELHPDVAELAAVLKKSGIFSAPRYIQKPAFRCRVLKDAVTFGSSHAPLPGGHYRLWRDEERCREMFPGTYRALFRMLVLPWNEFYTGEHVDFISKNIKDALTSPAGV